MSATDSITPVALARAACESVEARLMDAQIRTHESLRILRFAPYADLIERLAEWAHAVEALAEARRVALAEAVEIIAARDATIAGLRRQIAERRETDRRQSRARRRRPDAQAAA